MESWKNFEAPLEVSWSSVLLKAALLWRLDQVALASSSPVWKPPIDGVQQWQPAPKPCHCEISFFFLFFWLSLLSFCCVSWRNMCFVNRCIPLWVAEWISAIVTHPAGFLWLAQQAWHLHHSLNAACCSPIVVLLAFLQLCGTYPSLSIPSFLCWGAQKCLRCSWCSFTYA